MKFISAANYQEKLMLIFDQVKIDLLKLNPNLSIEHIGSSAIHGAISKGDLDILVRSSAKDFNYNLSLIKTLNFIEKEGTFRSQSLCMLFTEKYNEDVAIQLIEEGSEFEMFSQFKNYMNQHPIYVEEYNALKLSSMNLTPEEYRIKKSIFIESILKSAGIKSDR